MTLEIPIEKNVAYRFEDVHYSLGVDQWDDPLPGYTLRVVLRTYKIIKHTPKGIRIDIYGGTKFINLDSRKKWACLTKEEALESYIFRKKRQARILSAQLESTQKALEITLESTGCKLEGFHLIKPETVDFKKLSDASYTCWRS